MLRLITNTALVSKSGNEILENETSIVFCVLPWHKPPLLLCDARSEWRKRV